jgi:peptide deformylase
MTVRKVLRAGHPTLRTPNEPYPQEAVGSPEFHRLLDDLFETMHDYRGVGLAAPQVQENRRLLVYEVQENERYEDLDEQVPPTVMVNPEIIDRSEQRVTDWEGCLSYPDLRGKVPRSEWIRVRYRDREGTIREERIEGFEARAVQHEYDHLDGTLFVQRMQDLETLVHFEEYQRFHEESE